MRVFRTSSRLAAFGFAAAIAIVLQAGASRAEIKKQFIDYKDGDKQLSGLLVYDDAQSGKRPGVLLGHDRAGMAANAFRDSELIAKMGYVVFVADMFGKGFVPKDVPEMTKTITIYNNDRPLMRSHARAGFDVLKSNPMVDASKIALVGYCFGGTVVVELAETGVPVVGTISVHGSFRGFAPEAAKSINGKVLILQGAEDPVSPIPEVMSLVEQLRAAKVSWELQFYSGATHAFTDPKNAAEERADREYKVAMTRFLKEVFSNGATTVNSSN
ncbi:MAG TPA: dienelactone hydrolase family protein [Xanthobacteraceae bacterium]|jgi:dienelactone hydrolase